MIKKISLVILIILISSSCGKKGDPVYNEEQQNSKIFSAQQITLS
tara:strand:+ start:227 stop:361 length:135 start_codon:yes stop_codon:yes gene_type:complete